MKTIAEIKYKKMFSYFKRSGEKDDYLTCSDCWQRFQLPQLQYRTSYIYCPQCGKRELRFNYGDYSEIKTPISIKMKIVSSKAKVYLRIEYDAYQNIKDDEFYIEKQYEEFCFNSQTRRTTWRIRTLSENHSHISRYSKLSEQLIWSNEIDITDPLDVSFLNISKCPSILFNFGEKSFPVSDISKRSEVFSFLRKLREEIGRLIFVRDGRNAEGLYTQTILADSGSFLIQIKNLALKLAFPDAEIINIYDYYGVQGIKNCGDRKADFESRFFSDNITPEMLTSAIELAKQGKDYITCFLSGFDLPNKAKLRKQIEKRGILQIGRIVQASKFVSNYDLLVQIADEELWTLTNLERTLFEKMISLRSEREIARWIVTFREHHSDSADLFSKLSEANQELAIQSKCRISGIHDMLAGLHRKQKDENYRIDVPDYIKKRLEMQLGQLKFYLPEDSHSMIEAGEKLRNCLSIYSEKVKSGVAHIVLMTDEKKGKLTAAIRLKGESICEAKLFGNKPVSNNPKINNAIVKWAKEIGVSIDTKDISLDLFKEKIEGNVVELRRVAG